MKGMWPLIICFGVLLMVSTGWGDYYQYTDPDGVVRFTDDPSLIPSEQREDVQIHESIISLPMASEPASDAGEDSVAPVVENGEQSFAGSEGAVESEDQSSPGNEGAVESEEQSPPGNAGRAESEGLNVQREELLKIYREIEAEKKALGGPPPESAKSGVKADYELNSRALNQKIQEYNKLSMEFEKKVKEFNSRMTGK